MNKEQIYESDISVARWIAYDLPGNMGWIAYIAALIIVFTKKPAFMDVPLVFISMAVGILPAIAMLVGIVELISERIQKLDRILPKARLYRGFGALAWGGFGGVIVGLTGLLAAMRAGFPVAECTALIWMAAGGALCAVFAGLIFKTFRPQRSSV